MHLLKNVDFLNFGPISGRAFQQLAGALFRLLGLPRATFKATTKNTAVRRDSRLVGGPFLAEVGLALGRGAHY